MKQTFYLISAILLLFPLSACVDENYPPIFYTLANEYSTEDERGLDDTAGVVKTVSGYDGVSVVNYFALASKLIYRAENGDWVEDVDARKPDYNLVPLPAGLSGAACLNIEVEDIADPNPDNLFAGFYDLGSPAGSGLYYTSDVATPAGITWTQVSVAGIDDNQIAWIKILSTGELFVSVKDSAEDYALYYSDNVDPTVGANYNVVTFVVLEEPLTTLPYINVAFDGNLYFVTVGPYLYSGPLNNLSIEDDPVDPLSVAGRNLTGLLGIPGATDRIYVSGVARDQDGGTSDDASNLWMSEDSGVTWTRQRILEDATDSDSDVMTMGPFVDLSTTSPYILIGTVGFGYVELDTGDITTATVNRPDPAEIGSLDVAAINSFLAVPSPDPTTVFASTSGSGLWRRTWDGAEWEWKQE